MVCRNCGEQTGDKLLCDLGAQPFANALLKDPEQPSPRFPLAPVVCARCGLVQIPFFGDPFGGDYPYRSGQSDAWKLHLRDLSDRLGIRAGSHVIEVGGNDFTLKDCIPYGTWYDNIDPVAGSGKLTRKLGEQIGPEADYVIALNVLAHVPDLDDFIAGLFALLKRDGTLVVEVQDVEQLIRRGAWDTIYHEHMSYFSPYTLADALERRGFYVESVPERIATHGGSLRVKAHRREAVPSKPEDLRRVMPLPEWEPGLDDLTAMNLEIRSLFQRGKVVVGYGAPAKASTFLNFFGLNTQFIRYVVDSTPSKQGKWIPGVRVPIRAELGSEADAVVILAWNYATEILRKIPEGPEVWCLGQRMR